VQSSILILEVSRNRHHFSSPHDLGVGFAIDNLLQGAGIII
jgi:hypothetical protein